MARGFKVRLNNPALLTWARESAGYEVEDIADHLKKPVDAIHAWEDGSDAPTYRQLQKFANKVKRPVAALFLPKVPDEPSPPEDLRMLPGAYPGRFAPEALLAFRELRNSMAELRALSDELHYSLELSLPSWRGLRGSIAPRATHLRELLGITVETQMKWDTEYRALDRWRDVLFDRGVLVQVFPVPVQELRAFSILDHELAGVGISSKDAPRGRIFSLFHEVAHLCLRAPGVSGRVSQEATNPRAERIEPYCDAFAAAFLLPPSDPHVIKPMEELERDFTRERVDRYVRQLKVSKYVIARRVFDMGKLDPGKYWTEIDAWREEDTRIAAALRSKEKDSEGGPNYVTVRVSHAGKRYVATVIEAMRRGVLTTHEAAQTLSLKPERLGDAEAIAFSALLPGDV